MKHDFGLSMLSLRGRSILSISAASLERLPCTQDTPLDQESVTPFCFQLLILALVEASGRLRWLLKSRVVLDVSHLQTPQCLHRLTGSQLACSWWKCLCDFACWSGLGGILCQTQKTYVTSKTFRCFFHLTIKLGKCDVLCEVSLFDIQSPEWAKIWCCTM